jgi:6-phosphogluconolactonase
MIIPGPASRYYYAVDLGTDRLRAYRLDAQQGKLEPVKSAGTHLPPGSGPRHLAFHANGRFAYTINELASTVTLLYVDRRSGALTPQETVSTLPAGYEQESLGSEIQLGPAGHFLYASNRGHNSIAIYRVDETDGRLALIGHQSTLGRGPRHFTFDPTGNYLLVANQDTHSIVTFRVDPSSGQLSATEPVTQVPSPACICFRTI